MMKIVFIHHSLDFGGVEKSLICLANNLVKKYQVELLLFDYSKQRLIDELDTSISLKYVKSSIRRYYYADQIPVKYLSIFLKLYKLLLRFLKRVYLLGAYNNLIFNSFRHTHSDVVVSYVGRPGPWDLVAKKINAPHRITYVHNDPFMLGINRLKNVPSYYSSFNSIVCVSKDIKRKMTLIDKNIESKYIVIYNTINVPLITKLSKSFNPFDRKRTYHFVTVCRIDNSSKRLDRVIETSKILINWGFSNFIWHIVGDGPDYELLCKMVSDNSLDECIMMEGFKSNPYPYIVNSDLFILTSDYEGLPVTIMESCCLGTPVVSTKLDGIEEIIKDGSNGFLSKFDCNDIACKIMLSRDKKKHITKIVDCDWLGTLGIKCFEDCLNNFHQN